MVMGIYTHAKVDIYLKYHTRNFSPNGSIIKHAKIKNTIEASQPKNVVWWVVGGGGLKA